MNLEAILKAVIPAKYKFQRINNLVLFDIKPDKLLLICRDLYFVHSLELKTIFATDERQSGAGFAIYYVFGIPKYNFFVVPRLTLGKQEEFPSITPAICEASGYERKIKSFFGLEPIGHPDPRPMILHENWPGDTYPLRKDFNWQTRPREGQGSYQFEKVKGEGIYEIPVGPVHAGIIEPGHFRFSVAGEEIVLLEARLGYKHKGIEKLFETLPLEDKVKLSERVSGDTSFTHSLAFCQALETLAGITASERAKYLRLIFSELERLANHFNDVGFILLDTGFSFGGSNGGRLRESIMRIHERLSGSRFLRGVNIIGGVTCDITPVSAKELIDELENILIDFKQLIAVVEGSGSVLNRLIGTGRLERQIAVDHGVMGVAGRAVGLAHDARLDYPCAAYTHFPLEIALEKDGDVYARFNIRVKEISSSIELLLEALKNLPVGPIATIDQSPKLPANSLALGVTEGWRGEIVYSVLTDSAGTISRVDVRDPSFINWTVLGYSGKGNIVPDFPLINKSYNLSYSGNDL